MLAQAGVIKENVPINTVGRLVERDLARRRPFIEVIRDKESVSAGLHDAVIWESVLEVLVPECDHQTVVFVTKDKGFLAEDGSGIHSQVVEDLHHLSFDCTRLLSPKDLWLACTQIESLVAATKDAEARTLLLTPATDALLALQSETISAQTVYG